MSKTRLLNPYRDGDATDTRLGAWEKDVLRRLLAGHVLCVARHYFRVHPNDPDSDNYVVEWYWDMDDAPWYQAQLDGPVMMLLGRQAVRPVTCGGGRTTMVLTPAGKRKAQSLPKWAKQEIP